MRFGSTSAQRAAPVDRNPVSRVQNGSAAGAAPHGYTSRWVYTVPAGKKAVLQILRLFVQRVTAAAPVGQANATLEHTPSGGGAVTMANAILLTNAVNDTAQLALTALGDMLAGDAITASDSDTSTGGTVTFAQSAKVFEYDA